MQSGTEAPGAQRPQCGARLVRHLHRLDDVRRLALVVEFWRRQLRPRAAVYKQRRCGGAIDCEGSSCTANVRWQSFEESPQSPAKAEMKLLSTYWTSNNQVVTQDEQSMRTHVLLLQETHTRRHTQAPLAWYACTCGHGQSARHDGAHGAAAFLYSELRRTSPNLPPSRAPHEFRTAVCSPRRCSHHLHAGRRHMPQRERLLTFKAIVDQWKPASRFASEGSVSAPSIAMQRAPDVPKSNPR